MKFHVTWTETSSRFAIIEADSEEEALGMVKDGEVDGVEVDGGSQDIEVMELKR